MKKLLALVLAVIMAVAILPVAVLAEENVIPISECGGVLFSNKTYSISTAEEFMKFKKMEYYDDITIVLTNNITINDGVFSVDDNLKPLYNGGFVLPEPIENIHSFNGTFDGQGYTISGLYMSGSGDVGLLGNLEDGAVVKDINVTNSLFIGYNTGSICGKMESGTEVLNVRSQAIVIGSGVVGGIVGDCSGTIYNCYFNGATISDDCATIGGVVGIVTFGTVYNCVNTENVYGNDCSYVGGVVGRAYESGLSYCVNSGNVYGEYDAAGFACSISDSLCDNCYTVGEVYAKRPGNFTSEFRGSFRDLSGCCFVGEEGDTADYYGEVEASYEEYLNSLPKDPSGMGQIVDDFRVWVVKEEQLKTIDTESIYYKHYGYYKNFVIDMGNENNGYILPKSLQSRTVAPSITNVEYEKSSETRNTFTVTVTGRPAMIQFIEPTNGTRTYDRNHKNVTIKSYDADGNEVNSLDRTAAYEVWSIYSNMMPNVEIRTRAKYLSDAKYTWDSETYDFPMILANPIVSMELSATSGKKGPVPATVVADEKTEMVMFKMPDNTTVTVASKATDENGNKIFTGKAWMNKEGLNEIKILIYRNSVWRQAGTFEYTVK